MKKCANCGILYDKYATICVVCGKYLVSGKKVKTAKIISAAVILFALIIGIFVYVRTRVPDEDKLKSMIPDDLLEYTINGKTYKSDVVDIDVTKGKKDGKYYDVYCGIVLEDDYMDRTLYVCLEYKNNIFKGWKLCDYEGYSEPLVSLKKGTGCDLAKEYIMNTYKFDAPVFDDCSSICVGNRYSYFFDVNEFYEYIDVSGKAWVEGVLNYPGSNYGHDYDYIYDAPIEYKWSYDNSDVNYIEYNLKAEGMWVGIFTDKQQLRLNIKAVNSDKVFWESSTRIYEDKGDRIITSEGSSDLYFDEYEKEFYFDVYTNAGYYKVTFSADSAKLLCDGDKADSFEMRNDVSLEKETNTDASDKTVYDISSEKIYVYGWNEDLESKIELFKKIYPDYADSVEFVSMDCGGTSDEYFEAISDAIESNGSEVPSIVAYESSVLDKFSGSDYLNLEDIGITSDMYADAYDYTVELGTFNNELKAVTWASYPVCFVYRKDIAEEVLGTADPEEVANYIRDFDKFMETAQKMKDKGYYMLSGPDDIYPVKDVLDSQDRYDEIYQALESGGYTAGTQMWDMEWFNNFQGNVFGYFSAPWFTAWVLEYSAVSGAYGVTYAPEAYYWGGTYLGVTRNCTNNELAKLLLYTLCCDADFMADECTVSLDFPNNKNAVDIMINSGVSKLDVLGKQDPFPIYDKMAEKIEIKK